MLVPARVLVLPPAEWLDVLDNLVDLCGVPHAADYASIRPSSILVFRLYRYLDLSIMLSLLDSCSLSLDQFSNSTAATPMDV